VVDDRRDFFSQKSCKSHYPMKSKPPPSYALSVPGSAVTAPRDGQPLNRTKDELFLAVLFERSRATGWVVGEPNPGGQRSYHACEPPATPQARRGGPIYLSTKTLRRRLVRDSLLFAFRRFCQQPTPKGATMRVVNGSITQRDAWCPDDFVETYFSVLTPPVVLGEPDALIAGLTTTPLFSWCDLNAPEPATAVNGGDWICPNCGIMSATHGVWSSPPETWAKLCGRSYRYTLCVTCLLAFDIQLAVRN